MMVLVFTLMFSPQYQGPSKVENWVLVTLTQHDYDSIHAPLWQAEPALKSSRNEAAVTHD